MHPVLAGDRLEGGELVDRRLAQALIAAGQRLDDAELTRRGLEALDWYAEQCGLHTDVTRLVDAGSLTLDVGQRFPVAETAKVHELGAAGELRGKTVITVAQPERRRSTAVLSRPVRG